MLGLDRVRGVAVQEFAPSMANVSMGRATMASGENRGLYYVKVGHGGTFRPTGEVRTSPADVDAIFAHLNGARVNRLTLHFHGGLTPVERGLITAEVMRQNYQGVSHPITFLWETGFFETLRQNLRTLSAGDLFQAALRHVIGATAKRLGLDEGGRGGGAGLISEQIEAELDKEDGFATLDAPAPGGVSGVTGGAVIVAEPDDILLQELEAELEAEVAADRRLDGIIDGTAPEFRLLDPRRAAPDEAGQKGVSSVFLAKVLALISFRVLRRYWLGRNHSFFPTVVEEVLRELFVADVMKWIWDGMKTKASQMWRPNAGATGLDLYVGFYFLDRLAVLQRDRPELIVDLVGHSAGAIAICHLLAATPQRPSVRVRHVVFLAPACTVDLFHREVVTQPARLQQFRLFALRDAQERADRLVPYVYPWSLLYFVSGALEAAADEPILGLEWSLLGLPAHDSPEMRATLDFLRAAGARRLVWAGESGGDGLRSTALTHGAFDDDPETLASLRWLVEH